MRKKVFFASCLLVLIITFLSLSPHALVRALHEPTPLTLFRVKEKQTLRTITLYHVASVRTYQGSVTAFLQECAQAFEMENRGVYIRVEGLTPQMFRERLENGRAPDAYSFFSGDLYPEMLQQLLDTGYEMLPGLIPNACAAPYLFSGYAICTNADANTDLQTCASNGFLASNPILAARLSLCGELGDVSDFTDGTCKCAITDLRAIGNIQRSNDAGNISAKPLDAFTDLVCFFGIARGATEESAKWLCAFLSFLLSDEVQNRLTLLGCFPVSKAAEPVYSQKLLQDVYAVYREGVVSPDPFRWYTHKAQLLEDATQAVAGDSYAQKRFFDRWAVVFGG